MAAKKLHQLTPQSSGHDISIENLIEPVSNKIRKHDMETVGPLNQAIEIESAFSEMDKKTEVKRLRVRGLSAVSYCARLKAIGVNLFRAAKVNRALDALKAAPGSRLSGVCSAIFTVKELAGVGGADSVMFFTRRLKINPASPNSPRDFLRSHQDMIITEK